MAKEKGNIKSDILWRVGVIFVLFVVFGFAIIFRIVYLDVFKSEELMKKAMSFSHKDIIIEPSRGDIKTRDGALLATTLPKYEIRFDLKTPSITQKIFNSNVDSLAYLLSELFGDKSKSVYKKNLVSARKMGKRYFLIKRDISYPQLQKLKQFPIFRKGKYKGGLIVIERSVREKPFGLLASRSVGFLIDIDKTNRKRGFVGLERAYENHLKGEEGISLIRRLSNGRYMPVEEQVEPVDGSDIVTTIDIRFQDIVENELMKSVVKHQADYATAILMEVETGNILAIANLDKGLDDGYYESYNHAIGTSIEPGSTFKLASLIVALEDGYIDLTDTIDIEHGRKRYYDRTMKDDHEGESLITVQQVLEQSSNVGVSKIIVDNYKSDPRRFIEKLYDMNLNQKIGLEIKGEGKPLIKYPDDDSWSGVSLPWMSTGYELSLTPLQVLNFYNAVANGGKMVKPHFVAEIQEHGKTIKEFSTEVINPSICSKSTVTKAQKMLRGVVENGTARNINSKNLAISGKTGTAQIADKKSGYKTGARITYSASFVGFFPSDKPKYSCIVVVNNPRQHGFYGSGVAAPVFNSIANKVYAMSLDIINPINEEQSRYQIPYAMAGYKKDILTIADYTNFNSNIKAENSNWLRANVNDTILDIRDKFIATNRIPDVRGLGLRDAVYILENVGLTVKVYGTGQVKKQSLPVGQGFTKGERIVLELS
jgi:cell division protein FtsI (penicillin-binding protein 3)